MKKALLSIGMVLILSFGLTGLQPANAGFHCLLSCIELQQDCIDNYFDECGGHPVCMRLAKVVCQRLSLDCRKTCLPCEL